MLFFDQMKNGNVRVLLNGKCIGKIHPCPDPRGEGWEGYQFNDELPPVRTKGILMRRLCETHQK